MNKSLWLGSSAVLLGILACEPVIAIGWRELFIIFILLAFLLGPPIYRFIRKIENALKQKNK